MWLKLEPLTVLVGPNASGKSSILRAFNPQMPTATDLWKHDPLLEVRFQWELGPGTTTFERSDQCHFG